MKKIAFTTILLVLFSCISPKISVKKFSELIEIDAGDSAYVFWEFVNAKYVKVSGFDQTFKPKDSLLIIPKTPMRLDVYAYGANGQELLQSVYILVNPKDGNTQKEKQTIQRGPKFVENIFDQKSLTLSNYFRGFIPGSLNNLSKLKIFRIKPNQMNDSAKVSFGLFDEYGNFGYDVTKFSGEVKVEVEQKCRGKYIGKTIYSFPNDLRQNQKLDVFILVDYSIISENPNLKQQILNAIKYLDLNDRVSLYLFGNELHNAINIERADKFYWDLESFEFPKRFELSSIYRSLWQLIDDIDENINSTIILITNKMDNSSINYTLEDVIEKSIRKKVSINILSYGTEISPSTYSFISARTGGTSYHFPWKVEELDLGLTEVILSNKYYYEIEILFDKGTFECKDIFITLRVNFGQISFSDTYVYPLKDRVFYTNYQAVSLFENADTTINERFLPCINNLAELLISYRNLTVELIGTAGIGESYTDPVKLSLDRALAVRNRLLTRGVLPSQIKTKGIGFSKPLFPDEEDETNSLFNRRVEIRWLLPEVLPYTIVVDTVISEEYAERRVEFWEKQGFRSYYDRILTDKGIRYKVVLWGYPRYEDAEKDAKRISKKYGKTTFIE